MSRASAALHTRRTREKPLVCATWKPFSDSTPGGLNSPNLSRTHVLKSMPLGRTKSGENAWAHHTASHRTNEGMESQGREGSEGGKAGDQP